MKKINGLFISFMLGGIIGSAIALLYAPESGKRLRSDISKKTNKLIKEGKKKTHDLWNDAKEKAESTIESANDFLNTNVEKIVNKTENVKNALKSGINAYNDEKKS
jgi:gas vesicle protein